MRFATRAIHAAKSPDADSNSIMPPIYMTSTFLQESPGVTKGYDYTRAGNPNFTILEKQLAVLEKGLGATVFSSGLGALTALVAALKPKDSVIALGSLYGGTYRLFNKVFKNFDISLTIMEADDPRKFDDFCTDRKPELLIFETPANPLLSVCDIELYSSIAKSHGTLVVVDNTFATPYFQNPLDLGADVVWHSTTKYIGGHSDTLGGALITNDQALKERFDFMRMSLGLNPSPFDAWLITRGVKTLALRMRAHEKNAAAVAVFLSKHHKVKRVYYPGLEGSPDRFVAEKQMRGFGGMVSAEFDMPLKEIKRTLTSFKLFALAESLGGVESLVNHPALMTHASIPVEERLKMGITDGLLRFSCGIEDRDDLLEDLCQAIK